MKSHLLAFIQNMKIESRLTSLPLKQNANWLCFPCFFIWNVLLRPFLFFKNTNNVQPWIFSLKHFHKPKTRSSKPPYWQIGSKWTRLLHCLNYAAMFRKSAAMFGNPAKGIVYRHSYPDTGNKAIKPIASIITIALSQSALVCYSFLSNHSSRYGKPSARATNQKCQHIHQWRKSANR